MTYIQDIFSFYSSYNNLNGLMPSYHDVVGLVIIILLSFSLILKSFLLQYNAQYSERFCFGWSIFSIYFFCLNSIFGISLLILGCLYSVILIYIYIFFLRKKKLFLILENLLKNNYELLAVLPIVFILFSSNIKEWDSFAFWQPTVIYLNENFELPGKDFWHQKHPFSTVLIYFYSNLIGMNVYENIPSLFNLVILILFYISLKDYLPKNRLIYFFLLIFVFFNPLIINSKTFTNYADNSLAFVLFVIINFIYRNNFFIKNKKIKIQKIEIFYLFIFVSLLTGIKSSGFIFFIILFLSYLILFMSPIINYFKFDFKLNTFLLILLLLVPYITWRIYISNYYNGLNFFNHGFRLEILSFIFNSFLFQILEKKVFFINVFLLIIISFFIKDLKVKNLLKIVLIIVAIYNIFLVISYLVHFSYGEAKSATSYWRYNMQLSYLIFFCDVILFSILQNKLKNSFKKLNFFYHPLKLFLIFILISSPFLLIKKFRYDLFQPSIALIKNREKIKNLVTIDKNTKLFLVSNNPQINKKIYSYYLGIQTNYAIKQSNIKSVNFKNLPIEKLNLQNFDFLIEFFDNKSQFNCYKVHDCFLIKITDLKSSKEYKFNL